ncbi:interleukin-2 receptor subunit alpha-like [Rhinatrema bivittatum]|uniref:interleukin-2 receptor subunit alpha-like n=1 Tax=Rhinatrema bivittatum TaxID=194408 RepID=UPI00112E73DF|nr:interleukin-2 receptor subunit alpha-like [Rhinatrema bivittatum]
MEFLLPLIWGIYSFIAEANGEEEFCSRPRIADLAEITVDKFLVGSIIKYQCVSGYLRSSGSTGYFECANNSGQLEWTNKGPVPFRCIKPEEEAGIPYESKDANQSDYTDSCGHKSVPNATANVALGRYLLGQELLYRCQQGCEPGPGCSGTITCVLLNGKAHWGKKGGDCVSTAEPSPALEQTPSSKPVPRDWLVTAAAASCAALVIAGILVAWIVGRKLR